MRPKLLISAGDSIFEVGCGAGAFLYPFYQMGHRVAGIDYAQNLVHLAATVMPAAEIRLGEATALPTQQSYDVVVSNGVFLYFADAFVRKLHHLPQDTGGVVIIGEIKKNPLGDDDIVGLLCR